MKIEKDYILKDLHEMYYKNMIFHNGSATKHLKRRIYYYTSADKQKSLNIFYQISKLMVIKNKREIKNDIKILHKTVIAYIYNEIIGVQRSSK